MELIFPGLEYKAKSHLFSGNERMSLVTIQVLKLLPSTRTINNSMAHLSPLVTIFNLR